MPSLEAARICLWFFLFPLFVSLAYILTTGTYNGDFYGVPVSLDWASLTLVTAASLAPYALAWLLYKFFAARPDKGGIYIPQERLATVYFITIIWFIALAFKYDVGVLGREIYDAPALIKPIIQVSNRVNPFYLGVFFIAAYRGRTVVLVLGILLLITLGISRAGLGVFLYIALALAIRNHANLRRFFSRNKFRLAILICLFPLLVSQLYSLRASLRDREDTDSTLTATEIITARLFGRLSSISNSARIVQDTDQFRREVRNLSPFYFQRQAIGGVFGVTFIPEATPERLLININGGDLLDVSFMTGVPGNLYMAMLISPWVAAANIITIFLLSCMVFYFARMLDVPYKNEVAFMLLLYPLTSGVGNEFSSLVSAMLALVLLFGILNIPLIRRQISNKSPQGRKDKA